MAPEPADFTTPVPAHSDELGVAFPAPHVLQLTLTRPAALNAMTPRMAADVKALLAWAEDEPGVWCVASFLPTRVALS